MPEPICRSPWLEPALRGVVAPLLHARADDVRLDFLDATQPRPDAATIARASDPTGRRRACVMCSPPDAPRAVERSMDGAARAKSVLPAGEASHILEPFAVGELHGLSFAVMPECVALADGPIAWRLQRRWLRPVLLRWLRAVTAATVRTNISDEELERRFEVPLRHLSTMGGLDAPTRAATQRALSQLSEGRLRPPLVLMHGDLWKGNILLRPGVRAADAWDLPQRFVVIDWPGSKVHGHAFFDLLRLADSMRLPAAALRQEVARHCELLECSREAAMASLLAALGEIAMNLEHFPEDAFAAMASSCHAMLQPCLD